MSDKKKNILVLFDVDGTLTDPRLPIREDMLQMLEQLREVVWTGMVGGSDLPKQQEQIGMDVLDRFDFCFPENGLQAFKMGEKLASQSLVGYLGEKKLQEFINFCLHYIADLDIPIKRGTFIEFRNGMLNVSPIGRNCSQKEREDFYEYDKEANIRKTFVEALQARFVDWNLKFSIGGQISFDVFPVGWDKTYCLNHVREYGFSEIHFFGDKTFEGGNDFEIYESPETIGHSVSSPADTLRVVSELFLSN